MPQPDEERRRRSDRFRPGRSPVSKRQEASSSPHSGAEDDVKITALKLPRGKAFARDGGLFQASATRSSALCRTCSRPSPSTIAKLQAFVDYRQELVQNAEVSPSSRSR